MSRAEIVNAVIAKHEAPPAGAEPAPDAAVAPPGGASGAGSASADATSVGSDGNVGAESPAGATIDHSALQAKLTHDRLMRKSKLERKKAREEREAAEKARQEAEAAQKKWTGLGKDKSWLETIKEAGHDPRKVYEEMQAEARKSGTPEAQLEAMGKAFEAKLAAALDEHVNPLKKTIEELTTERDQLRTQHTEQSFAGELERGLALEQFQSLTDEYDPPVLLRFAKTFRDEEKRFWDTVKAYKVPLTRDDGSFTMIDILNALKSVQTAHQQRMQRRIQSAAPHTSQAGQQQPPQAKPPVNGTVERNAAPTTIGNDLAAATASEADKLRNMTRGERVAYVARKYGG